MRPRERPAHSCHASNRTGHSASTAAITPSEERAISSAFQSARRGLSAILCVSALADAGAQPAFPPDPLEHIAPHQRRSAVQQLIARQRAARIDAVVLDISGPVLTAFNSGATLDVGKAASPFSVTVKATDELSGVQALYFYATGPSGQTIYAYAAQGYPAKSVNLAGGLNSINRMLEPGSWRFTYGYATDAAGNYSYFDEAALDALGNTTFTVVNKSGYDLTKPSLTAGKLITTAVSLASHQPGTADQDRYVGASLTAIDSGNTALAGIRQGYADFCQLADPAKCIHLYGYVYATGKSSVSLAVGAQVSAARGNVPGDYELHSVYLYDYAGNYSHLQSDKFGGTTDFSSLLPVTVIKLKP